MKILVACEYSGVVRDAFKEKGHDVTSCDLLPTERPGKHLIMDSDMHLKDTLYNIQWDMIIGHPPCTRLCNSGVLRLYKNGKKEFGIDPIKWQQMLEAAIFFKMILNAPAKKVIVENPIQHGYATKEIGKRHSQIIQPFQFGHSASKATCLWLKGVPRLNSTKFADFSRYRCKECGNIFEAELGKYGCCDKPANIIWDNQTPTGQNKLGGGKGKERAKTYEGIAAAMADQWG
jgi:hypothetical protein